MKWDVVMFLLSYNPRTLKTGKGQGAAATLIEQNLIIYIANLCEWIYFEDKL